MYWQIRICGLYNFLFKLYKLLFVFYYAYFINLSSIGVFFLFKNELLNFSYYCTYLTPNIRMTSNRKNFTLFLDVFIYMCVFNITFFIWVFFFSLEFFFSDFHNTFHFFRMFIWYSNVNKIIITIITLVFPIIFYWFA